MKRNLYYKGMYQRKNVIKDALMSLGAWTLSWPRLLLEVFIRKNFGERYFSLFTAISLTCVLFWLPIGIDRARLPFGGGSVTSVIGHNATWYVYLAAFVYFAFKRQKEIKRERSWFEKKFSLYNGDINPRFHNLKIGNWVIDRRTISTTYEPLFCFIVGLVLTACLQKIGVLIIYSSICYGVSYYGEYLSGDHFVMDMMDEMIANENLVKSFVNQAPPEKTNGFEVKGTPPNNPDFRRKVADNMLADDEPVEVY
ncbi:hypothetical protein KXQ82_05720 [Mucilaginibacter sp. HMF5004]|uniref:hypothetical protein n=1 Tax=Mucilaginibacter rivuli TaxID=2857527 RepID=UPI001C5D4A62|nr:hypothetical protein [Mucilaginibacter rivuli]MBW4889201.1 hypothetical protein [Mucilaginibacter rivuli]